MSQNRENYLSTYLVLSSSTNITTTLACGFELKCSIIRSKSSDLALRDTFSDTAIQIPRFAAIEMNDDIPYEENWKKTYIFFFITIVMHLLYDTLNW